MVRPKTLSLTDHELVIMKILWKEAPLGVSDILERFKKKPKPAYTSLLTAVRAMEKKGYLSHEKSGKAYLYSPLLARSQFKTSALKRMVNHVFDGNAYDAAVNLIKSENLSPDEISELKAYLEKL